MRVQKKIIIVGAGISGLSAGCYACMNGYDTEIFEMNSIPGGLCAAWKRKGYTFDISMHLLVGSKGGPFHRMWQELGVLQDRSFYYHDNISVVESGGKSLKLAADPRSLLEQMEALSPEDTRLSKRFVRLVGGRGMAGAGSLKPYERYGLLDTLKMICVVLPHIGTLSRYKKMTIQEFAEQFQDPFLKDAVRFIIDSPGWPMQHFPMVALSGLLKSAVSEAGVPIGGSQRVVFGIADLFRKLGGVLHTRCRVRELMVQDDCVKGIRLDDGTAHHADTVIWAADGRTLIFDLLKGKYVNDEIRRMYDEWIPVVPIVHVMLGVNRDMSGEPCRLVFELEKPVTVAGEEHRWIYVLHHCFDPTMAPPGKSAVEVWYATRYEYWESLVRDRTAYNAEKKRIADLTLRELEKRWPGFASQVEVVDVPTPATYHRYTGNWRGSPDGWYITPENMEKQAMLRTLPGLSGLNMVGQWTVPFAGTVISALSGRQCIEMLCGKDKKRFTGRVG